MIPPSARANRGTTTRTSNDGPLDVFEMLSAIVSSGSSGRDLSQTSHATQANNASAIMISDVFMDLFMLLKISGDVAVVKQPTA